MLLHRQVTRPHILLELCCASKQAIDETSRHENPRLQGCYVDKILRTTSESTWPQDPPTRRRPQATPSSLAHNNAVIPYGATYYSIRATTGCCQGVILLSHSRHRHRDPLLLRPLLPAWPAVASRCHTSLLLCTQHMCTTRLLCQCTMSAGLSRCCNQWHTPLPLTLQACFCGPRLSRRHCNLPPLFHN
jgi:hypothetical protein